MGRWGIVSAWPGRLRRLEGRKAERPGRALLRLGSALRRTVALPPAKIRFAGRGRWRQPLPLLLAAALLLSASPLPAATETAQSTEAPPHSPPAGGESFAPSNGIQVGLAEHLRRQGFMFYGAWWCPACRQQKSLFGQPAAQRLPYLECEKGAAGQQRCSEVGIRVYPTWIKGGERREGVLSLEELKSWSRYQPAGAAPAGANP